MRNINSAFFALILLASLMGCQKTEDHLSAFQIDGQSALKINNLSTDSIQVAVKNELILSKNEENVDTIIPPGETVILSVTSVARGYYFVDVAGKAYRLFTEPDTMNELSISSKKEQLLFGGEFAVINEFLTNRIPRSDWNGWNEGLHRGVPMKEVFIANDSVRTHLQKQLEDYPGLPGWYKEYEHLRLDYVHVDNNLSGLNYRIKMMSGTDPIPANFLLETVGDLPLENNAYLGNMAYMRFLESYIQFKIDPQLENNMSTANREDWIAYSEKTISAAERNFQDSDVKDLYLANYFSFIVNFMDYAWKHEWLESLEDPEVSNFVRAQIKVEPLLAQGEEIPHFKLKDLESEFFEPKDFNGKVLLINFWATWCRPCIKEFEHENALVEQFNGQEVAIVNICLDSEEDAWRKMVDKYDLRTKNLFADEAWTATINEAFGSHALPHSILVDPNGRVIKNKCRRASAGVDQLIVEALDVAKN